MAVAARLPVLPKVGLFMFLLESIVVAFSVLVGVVGEETFLAPDKILMVAVVTLVDELVDLKMFDKLSALDDPILFLDAI